MSSLNIYQEFTPVCVGCGDLIREVKYSHLIDFCSVCADKIVEGTYEGKEIKALTWKEPFGSLMLRGKIETRTWNTKYRGLVLICCAKVPYSHLDMSMMLPDLTSFKNLKMYGQITDPNYINKTLGKAIAIGRLVDSRPMSRADEVKCHVRYNKNLYCHVYEDVKPIEPFDWKGSQGWRDVGLIHRKKIRVLENSEEFTVE